MCTHQTSSVEIYKSMRQDIGNVGYVQARCRLHHVEDDGCLDINGVTDIVMIAWLAVHVMLQSSRSNFCRHTEQCSTNFGYLAIYRVLMKSRQR